ncbi:MAG: fimbrial biogenesis outer membrane usher protein, partial [Proteobacteria bacterium]|nr:fimbrial biogenesis outer membrane usher protein [Pseudomonadota bacterium]
GTGVGRWDTSVDVQHFGYTDTATANASIAYYGNRAEVRVSHNANADEGNLAHLNATGSVQRSTVRVGSSIAFADGVVAVGPPIRTGSFAIVYPHESIAGKKITVGDQDNPRAVADGWGAAVVPDLPAYAPQSLGVDVADLPVGYSLGSGAFDVKAPYRGGYALEVGSAYSASVYGTLLQSDGQPVALATGTATQIGRPDKQVTFFTNASGKFGAEGLAPGRWQVDIASETGPLRFAFDVPKGLDGLLRIGELRPVSGGLP